MVEGPHIRIFPHSPKVFPSSDDLVTWLMTALKARGGEYFLLGDNAPSDLLAGSLVLFRHGNRIVGEAVVREYKKEAGVMERGEPFKGRAVFTETSIRLYSPPISIDALKQLKEAVGDIKDVTIANAYHIVSWDVYPDLLAKHVGNGGAFL